MQGAAGPAAEPAAKRARTAADAGDAAHGAADCSGSRAPPDGDCAEGLEAAGVGDPGSGGLEPGDTPGGDPGRGLSGHADPGLEEGLKHGAPWLEDGVAAPLAPERAAACYVFQLAAIPGRRGAGSIQAWVLAAPPCWRGGPVCQARCCARPLCVEAPVCEAQSQGDAPLAR